MSRNFQEWEDFLTPYFSHIKLLAEIPVSKLDIDQMTEVIQKNIAQHGLGAITRSLEEHRPHLFVTYLANFSAFDTEISFWGTLAEQLKVDQQRFFSADTHWGKLFLKLVAEFGLRDFKDQNFNNPYVSCIRIHGGIPEYFLPDFYRKYIDPSIHRHDLEMLSAVQLREDWLDHSYLDKTVRIFIENGGFIGDEFVKSCRVMARQYRDQPQDILDARLLELPAYVVDAYLQFKTENEPEVTRGKLRTPTLNLDPSGSLFLHLPSEYMNISDSNREIWWEIDYLDIGKQESLDNLESYQKTTVHRIGSEIYTEEKDLLLHKKANYIQVKFCKGSFLDQDTSTEIDKRIWNLPLLPTDDQQPLLVFRGNGNWLRWNQSLPPEELILVYPNDVELIPEGSSSHEVECFQPLGSEWQGWCAHRWDLVSAISIIFKKNGTSPWVPVPIQGLTQPELVGGKSFISDNDPIDAPLFVGNPPSLKIPLREGHSIEEELVNWQIEIEPQGPAQPGGKLRFCAKEFQDEFKKTSEISAELPLASLVGNNASGTFWLRIKGPASIEFDRQFRMWPFLEIEGWPRYILPNEKDTSTLKLLVALPPACTLELTQEMGGVSIETENKKNSVLVSDEVDELGLMLVAHPKENIDIHVPLFLQIPRLRWAYTAGEREDNYIWGGQLQKVSMDKLMQSLRSTLHLELLGIREIARVVQLVLCIPSEDENQPQVLKETEGQVGSLFSNRLFFPLTEFHDTIRHSDESALDFCVRIPDPVDHKLRLIPVLRLSRELDIQNVALSPVGKDSWKLTWEEGRKLKNRHVLLWSSWTPWREAHHFRIPDTSHKMLKLDDVQLIPSAYRIWFYVAPSWERVRSPLDARENIFETRIIEPEERLRAINASIELQPDDAFEYHLEQAVINESISLRRDRDQEIKWCYQNALNPKTPLDKVLFFYDWLGEKTGSENKERDISTQKALLMNMFRPENLHRVLFDFPDPSNTNRQKYISLFTKVAYQNIKADTCFLILDYPNDFNVVIHALNALIFRDPKGALPYIIDQVNLGNISLNEAFELLLPYAYGTLEVLNETDEDQVTSRLIEMLVGQCEEQEFFMVVDKGIKTPYGCARIDRILSSDGNELRFIRISDRTVRMEVTFHPEYCPLSGIVDLSTLTVEVFTDEHLFICTDGFDFVTTDFNQILSWHNHEAHGGIHPRFMPIKSKKVIVEPLESCSEMNTDQD